MLMEAVMRIMHSRVPFFLKPIVGMLASKSSEGFSQPRMKSLLKQAEQDLSSAPWFGGQELTAADISMIYPMEAAQSRGYLDQRFPNCLAWLERAQATPSYKEATQKDDRPSMIMTVS